MRFVGQLGKARVAMQIDVGFGDVVTPSAQSVTYPTLLDFPAPTLSGYPRETVIAEKFQAMVYLRTINSRMKDFYDVWLLASQYAFDGALLAKAIGATFANRAFRNRLPHMQCPEKLSEVVTLLAGFLSPIAHACAAAESFGLHWAPGGPWVAARNASRRS